jgi:hypothetical protein
MPGKQAPAFSFLLDKRSRIMLLMKEVPNKEIRALREGDFFIDGEIVSIRRRNGIVSIITGTGNLYTAHTKPSGYSIFRNDRYRRKREKMNGGEPGRNE